MINSTIFDLRKLISTYILLIFMLILFCILYYLQSTNLTTAILVTLIGSFFLSILLYSNNIFNPFIFFFMYGFLGFIDITMVTLGLRNSLVIVPLVTYNKSLFIMLIWFLMFSIGYFLTFKLFKVRKEKKINSNNIRINPGIIYVVCGIIFAYSIFSSIRNSFALGGIIEGMSGGGAAFQDQGYLLALLGFAGILPVMALYKGNKVQGVLLCLVIFIGILLTGRRSMAILTAFLPFLVFWNVQIKQIKFKHLSILAIPLLILIMFIGSIRTADNPNFSMSTTENPALEQLITLGRYNGYGDNIPALVNKIDTGNLEYQGFEYSLRGIEYFIPRGVWPEKPLVHSAQIVSDQVFFVGDTGRPVNAYGWAYFNFGFIGVILSGFFTGVIINAFYKVVSYKKSVIHLSMYALLILPMLEIFQPEAQMKILLFAITIKILEFFSKKGRFRISELRRSSIEGVA